ncbi:hypothetical protein [Pseudonocardia lacus]|uniref:hypothetical protein n=1 Tax=Pseudonocardia lacus TaxID=2835865 RepID=UPI001BDBE5C2|nr:hypothetical protein [Pseudonocardia lacus]
MSPNRFPVVDERALLPAGRRWMRAWRDPAELPVVPPGCVHVFGVDGTFQVGAGQGRLRGDEPDFVAANWVSIVNMRHRRVTATVLVPSTDPASDFVVHAVFGCQATKAAAVAQQGLTNLQEELESIVRHEGRLRRFRHRYEVGEIDKFREHVTQELDEAYASAPPRIGGVMITFEGCHVPTPRELRRHRAQLRDTTWSGLEQAAQHRVEVDGVRHEEELLRTPEISEATAVARGDTTAGAAATRMFTERDQQTERLIAHVDDWVKADGGKRVPVDRRRLADALAARLGVSPVPDDVRDLVDDVDGAIATTGQFGRDRPPFRQPDLDDLDGA